MYIKNNNHKGYEKVRWYQLGEQVATGWCLVPQVYVTSLLATSAVLAGVKINIILIYHRNLDLYYFPPK